MTAKSIVISFHLSHRLHKNELGANIRNFIMFNAMYFRECKNVTLRKWIVRDKKDRSLESEGVRASTFCSHCTLISENGGIKYTQATGIRKKEKRTFLFRINTVSLLKKHVAWNVLIIHQLSHLSFSFHFCFSTTEKTVFTWNSFTKRNLTQRVLRMNNVSEAIVRGIIASFVSRKPV